MNLELLNILNVPYIINIKNLHDDLYGRNQISRIYIKSSETKHIHDLKKLLSFMCKNMIPVFDLISIEFYIDREIITFDNILETAK